MLNRNMIGSSPQKTDPKVVKEKRLQKIKLEQRTLQQEREDEICEKLRKQREKDKIDLNKISVPEALKILAEKRANLFDEKTKLFSIELERMI